MLRLNRFILFFTLVIFLISCTKKEKNDLSQDFLPKSDKISKPITEQITMDKIILDVLYKLNIKPVNVQKITKNEGIFYYIPIAKDIDLEFSDMVLHGFFEKSQFNFMQDLKVTKDKLVKEYWDPIHKISYFIEIYYEDVAPGIPVTVDRVSDIGQLCIIVDDFGGFDGPLLDAFCETDPAVTFAVIPGLPFSRTAMLKALRSGHEVIVHMPMEPENPDISPGKNGIYHNMSNDEIYERVKSYFEELNYAVGANNHMGSRITQDRNLMKASLRYLAEKDYFFIDSKTTPKSVAYKTALEMGLASAERDLFLDAPFNSDEVLTQRIKDLERLKGQKNRVLLITHCFDKGRLERLNKFIAEAQKMGFELVPASKFVISDPNI